jgi:hypothetical protein
VNRRVRATALLQVATGIGILLFWAAFFTIGLAPQNPPECYFAYEHAFPFPDSVLAVGLVVAGCLLLAGKAGGRSLSLVCAGGLIFLGLLDFSFNLQNGIYAASPVELVTNGLINAWCVGFGGFMALTLGRSR